MKRLSCAAKANRIYVAVNLPELRLVQYPNQTIKYAKYNTNVVFNRHGRVVVRYKKRFVCLKLTSPLL